MKIARKRQREKLNQFPIKPLYHHSMYVAIILILPFLILKTFLTSCQCIGLISFWQLKQLVKDSLSFNFKMYKVSTVRPTNSQSLRIVLKQQTIWDTSPHRYCFLYEWFKFGKQCLRVLYSNLGEKGLNDLWRERGYSNLEPKCVIGKFITILLLWLHFEYMENSNFCCQLEM